MSAEREIASTQNLTAFFAELGRIYSADRILTNNAQLAPYESDGLTCFRAKPCGVVLPETQQEVIDTVKLCHRFEMPFIARGSGTSLS
ncbi:MAG: glycolate oxidase, partial [Porticoccaceae bacterium]